MKENQNLLRVEVRTWIPSDIGPIPAEFLACTWIEYSLSGIKFRITVRGMSAAASCVWLYPRSTWEKVTRYFWMSPFWRSAAGGSHDTKIRLSDMPTARTFKGGPSGSEIYQN